MIPQGTKRKLELMAPGDIKMGAPNILRQKRILSNSHFSKSAIADPSMPLQSGCKLGNYPRDIMFNIMGHLGSLLENWHGKHQYAFWRPNSSSTQTSSNSYDQTIPARFLNKAVYDISLQNKSSEIVKRNVDLRYRLGRNYLDYLFFKSPRIMQKNIDVYFQASSLGWLSPDDPESVFKGSSLPNPYNMGVEQWEKEATKVILSTTDVAYSREHWG
ncbi:hypothetical protein BOTCAL_0022g00510 [Botryotinia calthae]|uniref:Uncharacterized protein n=1 Tax=Botryotinia calthae TaxID=38488 RepID=A0A4Y8DH84_9HELO|nr:hypothetical protein BOTCAL_0022g00510 [Botryotinia calthae]